MKMSQGSPFLIHPRQKTIRQRLNREGINRRFLPYYFLYLIYKIMPISPIALCIEPFIDKFNSYEYRDDFDRDYYDYISGNEFLKKKKILMITLTIFHFVNI
jgi:hypothetical protein